MSASSSVAVPRVIHPRVLGDLVHALPDADQRGQVKNAVHALQGAAHGVRVGHVTYNEFDFRTEVLRPLYFPVNLRR